MGGSRIAVRTAQYVPDYMQVKIVDNDINRCNRLTELLDDKTMIINGDGRDMDLLIEEGLKNTEAFVALDRQLPETNISLPVSPLNVWAWKRRWQKWRISTISVWRKVSTSVLLSIKNDCCQPYLPNDAGRRRV